MAGGEAPATVLIEIAHPGSRVLAHPALVRELLEPCERRLQSRLGLLAFLLAFCSGQAKAADKQRQAQALYDEGNEDDAEGEKENLDPPWEPGAVLYG